jgi:PhnB protein
MTNASVQPYLFFGGRCEEALAFYRKAVGAQIDAVSKYSDSPQPPPPGRLAPGFENKVMHCQFRIGGSTLMASDGCGEADKTADGFKLALSLATEDDADRAFAALCEGGQVTMPLSKTFWSAKFGMLTDRFGIQWMVNVAVEQGK